MSKDKGIESGKRDWQPVNVLHNWPLVVILSFSITIKMTFFSVSITYVNYDFG